MYMYTVVRKIHNFPHLRLTFFVQLTGSKVFRILLFSMGALSLRGDWLWGMCPC